MTDSKRQTVIFPELVRQPVSVAFDQPCTTSDGGALLLRALDESLDLSASLVSCVSDSRQSGKVNHTLLKMFRQRVYSIACGYADCNDAARLQGDPAHHLLLQEGATSCADLASQSTLSRFENSIGQTDMYRLGSRMAEAVIGRHRKRLGPRKVKKITIDLDGSVDPTHGMQQLTLFNGHYDTHCYFPLFGFLTFNDETENYLFAAILRGGTAPETVGSLALLRRTIPRLQERFPRARIFVRLDAGFKGPKLLELLEELGVSYAIGLGSNSALKAASAAFVEDVQIQSEEAGETVTQYSETMYAASSWRQKKRRVICKAEYLQTPGMIPKTNVRYVVANLRHKPETVYKIYRQRGDVENRIKELKVGLQVDRTSCSSFLPNQLRVLLAASAYIIFQELRFRAARTSLKKAQVWTLQLCLIKIGGMIKRSHRRIAIHLAASHPHRDTWLRIARACGAIPYPQIT